MRGEPVGGLLDQRGRAAGLVDGLADAADIFDTSRVPPAACCTLRVISCVAAVCSSTAEAIEDEISFTARMVSEIRPMASTALAASAWIEAICVRMSSVAFAVCVASDLTSPATSRRRWCRACRSSADCRRCPA